MPIDKKKHVIVGILLFVLFNAIGAFTLWYGITISLVLTVLVAIGKEVYDKVSGKGTSEILDIIATMAIPVFIYWVSLVL